MAGRLGHELDRAYASFLLAADGWPALFQDIDVFGTGELLGSPAMERRMTAGRAAAAGHQGLLVR
ncbi:hypothetical protein [Streptomyces sp. NPDC001930]|uniref:hypothetical protein n=1 Tax=Streptomyces sp. NPDC001930 TaxID=3364625 RepID=UPI0036C39A02